MGSKSGTDLRLHDMHIVTYPRSCSPNHCSIHQTVLGSPHHACNIKLHDMPVLRLTSCESYSFGYMYTYKYIILVDGRSHEVNRISIHMLNSHIWTYPHVRYQPTPHTFFGLVGTTGGPPANERERSNGLALLYIVQSLASTAIASSLSSRS